MLRLANPEDHYNFKYHHKWWNGGQIEVRGPFQDTITSDTK